MTPPIDIRADHLRIVHDVLARHLPNGVRVWVFGSRATWMTKDSSDLDLALEGDGEIPARSLAALESAFEDSDLPYAVDIVDVKRIGERFRKIVSSQRVGLPLTASRGGPHRRKSSTYWRTTTLGETVTLQRGFDLPIAERRPGPYPVVASTGPVGTHHRAMVKGPGVVVGRSGSLGGGQFINSDFWPLNTTLWVKDFNANEPRFCYFLLKSLDLKRFNAGSGVPTLNRNHIHPLPIRVPPSSVMARK